MSRKGDVLYLGHMFDTVRKIQQKTASVTRPQFDADENLRLALLHLVQIVGEAGRRVSEEGRSAHPEVPWRQVIGMRHKIVHDYMDINEDILWSTVTQDIPLLAGKLAAFMPPDPPGGGEQE